MISVEEAKEKILQEVQILPSLRLPLGHAPHRVLAADVRAPIPLPLADNSAMDGFALKAGDTHAATPENPVRLRIAGTRRAGEAKPITFRSGEAIRIMTGATIPAGADAVVRKEAVEEMGKQAVIREPVALGTNIRRRGEDVQNGDLVLKKGTVLHSRSIGLLANLGLPAVKVYRPPRVALVVTGSELVAPGKGLAPGKIYDSNTAMLLAALRELHLEPWLVRRVGDHQTKLKKVLQSALDKADVIILVGGVSVGDYDFSKSSLGRLGVRTVFWKVAQKPGMPLFFGRKSKTLVFGLPGNPVSAWVCFFEYVRPALRAMQNIPLPLNSNSRAELKEPIQASPKMTVFLRGIFQGSNGHRTVRALSGQGSHMLKALAEANCLIPVRSETISAGSEVEVHSLEAMGNG